VNDDLGVRAGLEDVALRLELFAQLDEVIDLAVEDDLHGAVFVLDRLRSAGQVDDAESAVPQPDPVGHEASVAVGAAVAHGSRHAVEQISIGAPPVSVKDSGNTAHQA
jgi:hypothetical protein